MASTTITGKLALLARVTVKVVKGRVKHLVCAGAKSGGQIHHIATNKGGVGKVFEELIERVGMNKKDLDEWINKILLPAHPNRHSGGVGHPSPYHQLVYDHLKNLVEGHAAKGLDPAIAFASGLLDLADALCDPKSKLSSALFDILI